MDIVTVVKNVLGIRQVLPQEQVLRLTRLPKDQALKELGSVLYEECIRQASTFVNGELRRGDTPFKGISAAAFFHEMLVVAFWLVDRKAAGGKHLLLNEFHDNYFRFFTAPGTTPEERHAELMKKYEKYDDAWNDVTGHFDEFGLQVVQNMYGKVEDMKTRERTFWVIRFADDIVKACKPLKKSWKAIGLAPEKAVKAVK